mmetsp:Transcript_27907/g.52311  ORF Transcript_27907/g.52311 Transcript_27907/m.52311 type:complete len:566 (+) Transcript_27907:322-2019(+)
MSSFNNESIQTPQDEEDEIKRQQQQEEQSRRRRGGRRAGVGTSLPDANSVQTAPPASLSRYAGGQFRAVKMQDREPVLLRAEPTANSKSSFAGLESEMMSSEMMLEKPRLGDDAKGNPYDWAPLVKPVDERCNGWDMSLVQVHELPLYFPKSSLNYDFEMSQLEDVLTRISYKLRSLSIQADLCHSPLSAKLQTCENVELYLVFFLERKTRKNANADPSTRVVSMSVQHHKGDQMISKQYVDQLVEAAKGVDTEESGAGAKLGFAFGRPPSAESVQAMEKLIERIVDDSSKSEEIASMAHPTFKQSPEDLAKTAIRDIHSWLEFPKRLDLRRNVLEYLTFMTDLTRTLKSTAIAGSLVVLQGKAPAGSGMDDEAKVIQSFVLTVLQNRELPGDRDMFEGFSPSTKDQDNDIEMRPYFPEEIDSSSRDGLPHFYVEYMNELFHMALQVLVQSLEVVACFRNDLTSQGWDLTEMAKHIFVTASQVGDSKDLYSVLLGCVGRAETKLANGYLACKALRLLAMASPGLKERLKLDENAKLSISNAYQVGQTCHSLLQDESYQLWETVRQ